MSANKPQKRSESEAIREWVDRYEPRLLSRAQRSMLPELRELVVAADFSTLGVARAAMSQAVRFVADMAAAEEGVLSNVFTELNISAWRHGGPGSFVAPHSKCVSNVRRLYRALHGVSAPPNNTAPASEPCEHSGPAFSAEELATLAVLVRGDAEAAAIVIAVVGAGLVGPESNGAVIESGPTGLSVQVTKGGNRSIPAEIARLCDDIPLGPVNMDGWRNFANRATRAGVHMSQYRGRDAWALRVLSEHRPLAEVFRDLGISRSTIAAAAPLLVMPPEEQVRQMLRGAPTPANAPENVPSTVLLNPRNRTQIGRSDQ